MCVCDVAHVDIGKRANGCEALHVPVCVVVCAMVCARGERHMGGCKQGQPPVVSDGIDGV
jgi:hypothetical protein